MSTSDHSTVIAPTWHRTISHWWPFGLLVVEAALLGVMLYFDGQYGVANAFPLRGHPTQPFIAFLTLGTVCFPFGTGFLLDGLRGIWRASMSRTWPTVAGRILKSEVSVNLGRGPRNRPEVGYEYEVGGKRYEGSVIRFAQWKTRFYDSSLTIVNRYPVGASVPVHYDPDDPTVAVLDTSAGAVYRNLWAGLAMLVFPLLGFFDFFRDILNG